LKAIVVEKPGDVRVRDVPDPECGPNDVVIAPRYAGICGTDMHVYLGEMNYRVTFPTVLGHESAGVIVDVGSRVEGFSSGDPVAIDPVLSCGICPLCRAGKPNVCPHINVIGIDSFGAMAERIAVPSTLASPIAQHVDLKHCVLLELYAVAVHASRRTNVQVGDTLAIFGAGKLGLALLDVFKQSGASMIMAVDIDPVRLDIAEQLGADTTINARECDPVATILKETGGIGADKVIEAVGHYVPIEGLKAPTEEALNAMKPGGQVTVMGQGAQIDNIAWRPFVLKEGTIVGSRLNVGDMPRAIGLLESGQLHPELLITHELPPYDAAEGFEWLAQKRPDVIKVSLDLHEW